MSENRSRVEPAAAAAALLVDAFADYNARFADITRRAARHFARRDWLAGRRDAVVRMELYDQCVGETFSRLEARLGERIFAHALWVEIRRAYAERIADLLDSELYKTFFNTLTRRFFHTRGVDPEIEFIALDIEPTDRITHPVARHSYVVSPALAPTLARVLYDCPLHASWADLPGDAERLAAALAARFADWGTQPLVALEFLETLFYRERRAYLVGRALGCEHHAPCVLALVNGDDGVRVDAVLTAHDHIAVLFGYTHNYFHADLPTVGDAVVFLRALLPQKPVDELYSVLGRAKQGKTERYRHFFRHLAHCPDERLCHADGQRGLVMSVFHLPSYPLVFKVLRDRFGIGKSMSATEVMAKYRMVALHDKVGRLVDVQEFRWLRFPRTQFTAEMLAELIEQCAQRVLLDGDDVVVTHCYVERRLRPLDLYLRESTPAQAEGALIDYGQAVKDLAASNIFPGDLLPKNFGVSRSGRVVFYDYDEISRVSDCLFRAIPLARHHEEEIADGAWFHVGENDVFPEQFPRFLGLDRARLQPLLRAHPEIFDPGWWQAMQAALRDTDGIDVAPYPASARLR